MHVAWASLGRLGGQEFLGLGFRVSGINVDPLLIYPSLIRIVVGILMLRPLEEGCLLITGLGSRTFW